MSKKVFLIGGGGHGRVVLDALLASGVTVSGILDPKLKVGDHVFEVPIVGNDGFLEELNPKEVILVNGLGANPNTQNRKKIFEAVKAKGFSFYTVRHGSAVIGFECELAEGTQIMAGAVLQNRIRVNKNAVINTRASVDHDCIIGTHTFISPGAVLCGGVTVAESAFIGAGAVVLPEIQIGANAVVGAGTVVTKAVPEGWIVVGNPAGKIGMKTCG